MRKTLRAGLVLLGAMAACSDEGKPTHPGGDGSIPAASCQAAGGAATVNPPVLALVYKDRWHEGWLASPAVADLDGDGKAEVIAARHGVVNVWDASSATLRFAKEVSGRIALTYLGIRVRKVPPPP